MRADLLDAIAAVDWAQAQLPALDKDIDSFFASKPYRIVAKSNPNGKGVMFFLADVKAMPPIINAEVGAILNSIRSSLDLLSAALARRNGKTPTRYMHFPIWDNPNDFSDPIRGIQGSERKKWLSDRERGIIEALKPYPGGNDEIWALHQLDIIRKHERLVGVDVAPGHIRLEGHAVAVGLSLPSAWPSFENDAVVAIGRADAAASECNIHITLNVTFNESVMLRGPLPGGKTLVVPGLFNFAKMADRIIGRFDYP